MFRQAWTWLHNWHEPAIVGAAVALFGLAYLLPLATGPNRAIHPHTASTESGPTAFALGLYDIPQDDQHYRDQWIAEADAFYRDNPPRNSEPQSTASQVITASARTPVQTHEKVAQSPPVGHQPVEQAEQASQPPRQNQGQVVMALPPRALRWRVATCLAAGLLASLLFVSIWPATRSNAQPSLPNDGQLDLVGRGEAIPVRIPTAWIGVRPTLRQTARRSVLSGSYLVAALGAWGIVS